MFVPPASCTRTLVALRTTNAQTARRRRCVCSPIAAASTALATSTADKLRGTNIFVVGDDTKRNADLAASIANSLRYSHFSTTDVLEKTAKKSMAEIVEEDGPSGLALLEAMVLENLCFVARCSISTLGEGIGAAARGACWRHMHGGITVWLDLETADGPQRGAYEQAEIHLADVGGGNKDLTTAQLTTYVFEAIDKLIDADTQMVGKKSLYVRLGARGDWPNLAAPGPIEGAAASP